MSYWNKVAYRNPFCFKFWDRKYRLWTERRQGIDFSIFVNPEDLGYSHARVRRSSPTGARWMRRMLRHLPITPHDSVLDIGCGKGAAMRVLLEFPFGRVDGVELADPIAEVARRNFTTLRVPGERCRVFTADASVFDALDPYTHIYFYNPFSSDVMRECMKNIRLSLQRSPRRITIIYNNPSCHDDVVAGGIFSKVAEYPAEWGNKFFVYYGKNQV